MGAEVVTTGGRYDSSIALVVIVDMGIVVGPDVEEMGTLVVKSPVLLLPDRRIG